MSDRKTLPLFPKKALTETVAFHYSDIKNLVNISQETWRLSFLERPESF